MLGISAAANLEGAWAAAGNKINSFSPQQFIDCSSSNATMGNYSPYGCNGGFANNAFLYAYENNGVEPYIDYSYADMQSECQYNPALAQPGLQLDSCTDIASGSETDLAYAVYQIGPISIAIDAGLQSFHNYVDGVYYAPACSSTELDHAVLATGYGVMPQVNPAISLECSMEDFYCVTFAEGIEIKYPCMEGTSTGKKVTDVIPGTDCNPSSQYAGQEFWMVKNSWGVAWGMEGYILMARNMDNNCGIATNASYAQLAQ